MALMQGGHLLEQLGEALLVAVNRHNYCAPHLVER
jgi:hypothetical protein